MHEVVHKSFNRTFHVMFTIIIVCDLKACVVASITLSRCFLFLIVIHCGNIHSVDQQRQGSKRVVVKFMQSIIDLHGIA